MLQVVRLDLDPDEIFQYGFFVRGALQTPDGKRRIDGYFLIDTGANVCAGDADVLARLNPPLINDPAISRDDSGILEARFDPNRIYSVDILLEVTTSKGANHAARAIGAISAKEFTSHYTAKESPAFSQHPVIGILGRPILKHSSFSYSGSDGIFKLELVPESFRTV